MKPLRKTNVGGSSSLNNSILRQCGVSLVTLAAAILGLASGGHAAVAADCSLVPGWQQDGPVREFTPDNLYEYVDGNAEGYLIYGFTRMQNLTCKSGEDSIVIDVSEMTDSDAAYGIFTTNRDAKQPIERIGMGGQILPLRATFSKGKYYVELAASPGQDYSAALRAFAAKLEKRITGTSSPPVAVNWFPTEKLIAVRLIPRSVLGLGLLKRGYVAEYEQGKAFVVIEESPESAATVMNKLRQRFGKTLPAKVADEAFQAEDQYLGGLCIFRKGRYLGGFANLPDAQSAALLAGTLAVRIP